VPTIESAEVFRTIAPSLPYSGRAEYI
jgi:hypothetical protein